LGDIVVKEKKIAAAISIISNLSLILLKLIAGFASGSIGIISEAIHSGSDLFASVITFISVSESSKPADNEHHFGHGKYEDLASFIEGSLIILVAFYIIYEAVKKIICLNCQQIDVNIGLFVMFISVIANFFVSMYLFKIAQRTGSSALHADGEHLRTDIYSSLGVFGGLLLVKITGYSIFDPIMAMIVAGMIFMIGYKICYNAQKSLLDTALSEIENEQIRSIIESYLGDGIIALKTLRTRKAGLKNNIEIVLIVDKTMSIQVSHELCDKIEFEITKYLKNTEILIHLEPNI
jgi:cation diffusion facilitator family transporter